MMSANANDTASLYYAELSADYPNVIRQLVPRYDDMLETMVDLVVDARPNRVLDLGAGPGSLAARILERAAAVRVTAVEISEAMVREARHSLEPFGYRSTVVQADVTEFEADPPYDVICSNLVLHNVPYALKPEIIRSIHAWLAPRGIFVWGDFIRHDDITLQEHTVRSRMAFAREAGCPKRLIEWTFRKEAHDDAPLSVADTIDALEAADFDTVTPIWMHDAFLIVRAQA